MSTRTISLFATIAIIIALGIIGCSEKEPAKTTANSSQKESTKPANAAVEPTTVEPVAAKKETPLEPAKPENTSNIAENTDTKEEQVKHPNFIKFIPKVPVPGIPGTAPNVNMENLKKEVEKAPQFYAPKGTTNLALEKPVTASESLCSYGDIDMLTDGDKDSVAETYFEMAPGLQWVQIDLEEEKELYAILVWHYMVEFRVYHDVIVQVSNDEDFLEATTLFNNDHDNSASSLGLNKGTDKNYWETNNGKLIDAKGVKARYIRLYSNGNSSSNFNHYVEVEVYGI